MGPLIDLSRLPARNRTKNHHVFNQTMTRTNQDSCMSSLTSNAPPTPTTSTTALNHANCWDDTACSASSNPKDKNKNIGDDDQSGDSRGQKRKWEECNREEDEVDRTKIETPLMFSSMEQPSKKQKETEEGIYVGEFLERVARAREQMTNDFLEMRQRLEKIKDESIQLQAALDTQNRELDELEKRAAENQREQMKTNKMID